MTGRATIRTSKGYIDIQNGAFGVPRRRRLVSPASTRGSSSSRTRSRIQEFQILDEHGEPLNVGRAGGPRAAGRRGQHRRSSPTTSRSSTTSSATSASTSRLKITGELRRPRIEGDVRLEAARLEVDRILQLFYDPYSVEALPDVVSAERTVEGSGSAEEATKSALAQGRDDAAAPGGEGRRQTPAQRRRRPARSTPSSSTSTS